MEDVCQPSRKQELLWDSFILLLWFVILVHALIRTALLCHISQNEATGDNRAIF